MTWTRSLKPAILIAVAVVSMALTPSDAIAERTLGLSSGTFKYELAAGDEASGTVYVTNDGDEPIRVLVYASDQSVDATGGITYSTPGLADLTSMTKPSAWVRIVMPRESMSLGNIPYLVMHPGDRVPVEFTIAVPPSATPGDHNLLIFFEMFEQPAAGQSQVAVSGRIGARVILRVQGELVERLEVRPFEVPPWVIGSKVRYSFLVRNSGNTDRRVTATVMLLDRSGSEVATAAPILAQKVFAAENLQGTGMLSASRALLGPHTLRLDVVPVDDEGRELDHGRDRIIVEREVWFVPLWLVVAAALFFAAFLVRGLWVAARRSERRYADRDVARAREDAYHLSDGSGHTG